MNSSMNSTHGHAFEAVVLDAVILSLKLILSLSSYKMILAPPLYGITTDRRVGNYSYNVLFASHIYFTR